jgi:hypothetical protein
MCGRTVECNNATFGGYNKTSIRHTIKYIYSPPILWRQLCEVRHDMNEFLRISGFMGRYETRGIRGEMDSGAASKSD